VGECGALLGVSDKVSNKRDPKAIISYVLNELVSSYFLFSYQLRLISKSLINETNAIIVYNKIYKNTKFQINLILNFKLIKINIKFNYKTLK